MSYVGRWIFHSIGVFDDSDKMVYMNADEYLHSPMPYIDESDEEAVADEMKERKQIVGAQLEVCEDGKMYMLMPLPDGVSQEEIDEAVNSGMIMLRDGMLTGESISWEERDGAFYYETDMNENGWENASEADGFLTMITTRYVKAE